MSGSPTGGAAPAGEPSTGINWDNTGLIQQAAGVRWGGGTALRD